MISRSCEVGLPEFDDAFCVVVRVVGLYASVVSCVRLDTRLGYVMVKVA